MTNLLACTNLSWTQWLLKNTLCLALLCTLVLVYSWHCQHLQDVSVTQRLAFNNRLQCVFIHTLEWWPLSFIIFQFGIIAAVRIEKCGERIPTLGWLQHLMQAKQRGEDLLEWWIQPRKAPSSTSPHASSAGRRGLHVRECWSSSMRMQEIKLQLGSGTGRWEAHNNKPWLVDKLAMNQSRWHSLRGFWSTLCLATWICHIVTQWGGHIVGLWLAWPSEMIESCTHDAVPSISPIFVETWDAQPFLHSWTWKILCVCVRESLPSSSLDVNVWIR